ncbi:MAG: ABC transporter permease [Acidimicrobiales bacterium]
MKSSRRYPSSPSSVRLNPSLIAGLGISGLITVLALLSFVWTPFPPDAIHQHQAFQGPSLQHILGTDEYGRDLLSRIMTGARSTLEACLISVTIAASVGTSIGVASALARPTLQGALGLLVDLLYGFPALLAALLVVAIAGSSTVILGLAIGVATTAIFARVTRSRALQIARSPYVTAAQWMGVSKWRIATTHIARNLLRTITVQSFLSLSLTTLAVAALSFLGLGAPPPNPSWGSMLEEGQSFLQVDLWIVVVPTLAIVVTVFGFNLLSDGLRDREQIGNDTLSQNENVA